MYEREVAPLVQRLATLYPVIGITGPRQSGKTTLAKMVFPHLAYVSFENIDTQLFAKEDPRGFLRQYSQGAIFDEVQHVPEILSYLQEIVDTNQEKGRYVVTGSQNFALTSHVSQSLAGRVAMISLLPLSLHELGLVSYTPSAIFEGGYPNLHKLQMHPREFFPHYMQTYVERDVRQIRQVENLRTFQHFLSLCAGRVGQLINVSSLAVDAGISHTTARQWLSILEASYIIFFLTPFHKNYNKRLVKMPKLYFYDTGLACSLLGIENAAQIDTHFLKGALFENLMIVELVKGRLNRGMPPRLSFWRDHAGHEVDCIGEWSGVIHAIEIKMGSTFQSDFGRHLRYFMQCGESASEEPIKSYVLYTGEQEGLCNTIERMPIKKIHTLFDAPELL